MFKRFLKFLKGDEAEQLDERFEGSYLDHVLEEVRPRVEDHLEKCPGHDPVLLVVVEVLRTTMKNAWAPGLREPLVDSSTPGVKPPPPPTSVGDASQVDSTNELDIVDEGIAYEDTEGAEDLSLPEADVNDVAEAIEEGGHRDGSEAVDDEQDHHDEGVESADSDDTDEEDESEAFADDEGEPSGEEHESEQSDDESEEHDEREEDQEGEEGQKDEEDHEEEDQEEEEEESESDDDAEDSIAESEESETDETDTDETDEELEGGDDKREADEAGEKSEEEALALDADDVIEESEVTDDEAPKSSRITEEINISEIRDAADEENAQDITVEVDRNIVQKAADLPRVDNEEVLQAGRVFLKLLLENDQLPSDLQLSVGETMLARDLLLGYFVGDDGFETKAKRLLSMVETKFGEGLFSQAKILLELFQTDESTRVNNDRNLFYEDMILRLGIRRRSPLDETQNEEFASLSKNLEDEEALRDLIAWLDAECLVKFRLRMRDPSAVETWHGIADTSSRAAAANLFKAFMPPSRWRGVEVYPDIPVFEQLRTHVTHETAQKYVISQIKTAYFILRAVGDTGLEIYLDKFFDWTEEMFDINGTLLMPQLYNRSMMDVDSMDAILAQIYREHFELHVLEVIEDLDDETIDEASVKALEKFTESNLGEVAPGYYDLGAFVFDEIFEMPYPTDEFASKVHRLT